MLCDCIVFCFSFDLFISGKIRILQLLYASNQYIFGASQRFDLYLNGFLGLSNRICMIFAYLN